MVNSSDTGDSAPLPAAARASSERGPADAWSADSVTSVAQAAAATKLPVAP